MMKKLLIAGAALILLIVGAFVFYRAQVWMAESGAGNAELRDANVVQTADGDRLVLTLVFLSPIEGASTDVRITAQSAALGNDSEFLWSDIVEADGTGTLSADGPPPINQPVALRLPVTLLASVRTGVTPDMTVELYWGGEKQHGKFISLGHIYGP